MDRSHRRRLSKGTTMTAPRIAIAFKALLVGLSLSSIVGCSAFEIPVSIGIVTAPTSYSLEGTTWAGRYNDSNGRGNGTLTIVFDRARDRGSLYGNWVTTFPDATRNISGPVQLYANFSSSTSNDAFMELGTPHFNVQGSTRGGCWMTLVATVSGSEMTGRVNTGQNICDPAETQRSILVTLSKQ